MSHRFTRALGASLLAASLATTLVACGGDEATTTATELSATEHNDTDVAFARDMVQHHAQAVAMVEMTRERDLDPEVAQLAEGIRDAQVPEIETFSDWLGEWDEEVPPTMLDHANAGHGSGDMSETMEDMDDAMPGMMSGADMDALQDAGGDFQTMWLEMMIEHHEGAIEMARTEQQDGRYRPAVELAAEIEESQGAEIETMRDLLG
ncbi:DUF305 domain-containing protein [Nocardioides sp. SOB44]|uniref:DUF305 domain-containing protein n=1 Tax=Nocardioides cremeus TaxID=3058044 RepID=A0ABT8TR52_9ACTN|nr:DUF305 domain-containing protein [Nocardioides cremeus]MDO3396439.1 DUF305 domain-containing protein [Nocardioides cremeus]